MNITVTDDMSLENQETFSLSLLHYPGHDDRILLDVVEKVVTITDTNRKTFVTCFSLLNDNFLQTLPSVLMILE